MTARTDDLDFMFWLATFDHGALLYEWFEPFWMECWRKDCSRTWHSWAGLQKRTRVLWMRQ